MNKISNAKKIMCIIVCFAVGFSLCPLITMATSYTYSTKEWTIMVYLDGDCEDIEDFAIDEFEEIASVGSTSDVNILVLMDRISGYDTRYSDWDTCKWFYVEAGMDPDVGNELYDFGEENMADPDILRTFLLWSHIFYPADHTALIFADHGGAAKGCCRDDTSGGDMLNISEIEEGLDGYHFDVIGFDACIMGSTEVAYHLRDYADVMVGSENVVWADVGWAWDDVLTELTSDPTMTGEEFGEVVVDEYADETDPSDGLDETMSAIDLTKLDTLAEDFKDFNEAIIGNIHDCRTEIVDARLDSHCFLDTGWIVGAYHSALIDLYDFADELYNRTSRRQLQWACLDLMNTIDDVVIHEYHDGNYDAHGLTVYFPCEKDYVNDTSWSLEIYPQYVDDFAEDTLLMDVFNLYFDDYYESNNHAEIMSDQIIFTGFPYGVEDNTLLSSIAGYGNQSDSDWYQIEVPEYTGWIFGYYEVEIDVTFTHADGNIDIAFYEKNEDGTITYRECIAKNCSNTDNEYLVVDELPRSGDDYYIQIFGDNNGNLYDLSWDYSYYAVHMSGGSDGPIIDYSIFEDDYENNDCPDDAYDLSSYENVWLSTISGNGMHFDDDWYQINVQGGHFRLQVELDYSHTSADLDMAIYDAEGQLVVDTQEGSGDESIDYYLFDPGVHYIRVYGNRSFVSYDLKWNVPSIFIAPFGYDYSDDNYEENDVIYCSIPYDLTSDERTWLSTIDGIAEQWDDDWYMIEMSSNYYRRLVVELDFEHEEGNIDIAVYDSTGAYVTGSESETDNESIDYTLSTDGIYYIKIYGRDARNEYDLWWDDQYSP